MPPIKVLYMLHDSRRSGVPAVTAALIMSLDRSAVEPIVYFAYDGVYAHDLRQQGVEVKAFSGRYPFVWRLNRFLMNIHLLWLVRRVDIVHVNSVKLAFSAVVARLLGARVVFHLHEKVGRFGRLLLRAMAMADCTVFCAANCADHYLPVTSQRKRTILNAISIPETALVSHGVIRAKIVMLGSINRNKGQDLLLQAFALLDRHDAELWFYGTVGLSAHGFVKDLKKFVRDNALANRVFFPGPTHDAAAVFREATLLVHSSLNECLSISILEAMAHGVPVIANDIAGMGEIITSGVDGMLVEAGDVKALAAAIAILLDDRALREKLGRAGRETVVNRFDMVLRAQEFFYLYRELVRRSDRSTRIMVKTPEDLECSRSVKG